MAAATNTTYPVSKQEFPSISAGAREDDPGIEHDVMHDRLHATVNAIQEVLGVVGEDEPEGTVLDRLAAVEAVGSGGGAFATTFEVDTATHDIEAGNVGKYHRFTYVGTKTCTYRPEADEALPANGEWHIRNAASSDLTLVAGSGVTLNPAAGGSLVVPPGGTVTVKRVATNVFDVIGVTKAP